MDLFKLPTEPGTVIAIGEWWLVRLRPYEGAPSAWELLSLPAAALKDRARRNGIADQCVYDDEWVLGEVQQEGGFDIISTPGLSVYGERVGNWDHYKNRGQL